MADSYNRDISKSNKDNQMKIHVTKKTTIPKSLQIIMHPINIQNIFPDVCRNSQYRIFKPVTFD